MCSHFKELYIDSVEFSYDHNQTLLTGVYLKCEVGNRIALLGRNGSGKSTFLKIIFGSLKAKNAFIRLNGKRVTKAYLSKDICYLPQDSFLPTSLKVYKAVDLMISDKKTRSTILGDKLIHQIREQLIADLSEGELRYLEIMLLLSQPATFILLDEPFSGTSPIIKERISELIMKLSAAKGIIISDHDYRNVLAVSNHVLLLQNGGCREIKNKHELEMFYVPEGTFDNDNL